MVGGTSVFKAVAFVSIPVKTNVKTNITHNLVNQHQIPKKSSIYTTQPPERPSPKQQMQVRMWSNRN